MIRWSNHKSPAPTSLAVFTTFPVVSLSLSENSRKGKPNQGLCVSKRLRETSALKGICHFQQIGLERIKQNFSPYLVPTVKTEQKWECHCLPVKICKPVRGPKQHAVPCFSISGPAWHWEGVIGWIGFQQA